MHSLQFIAVEFTPSSDPEDADQEAVGYLESMLEGVDAYPKWSDWYSIKESRWISQYTVVNAAREPDRWKEYIDQAKKWRAEHVKDYLGKAKLDDFAKKANLYAKKLLGIGYQPWNALDNMGMDMNIYYTTKLASLMNDEWTSESVFYDLQHWTSQFENIEERVTTNPENQFLIPVDFHH